jgi:hypothetical protein
VCQVTAKATFQGQQLTDIPVINPGNWFGKSWLIEIGGSFTPVYFVVEADNVSDAIDELADNDQFGHHIVVSEADQGDYDPDNCHYGPHGQILDLDHLLIHGQEGAKCPFPCRYFGDELPQDGMSPTDYWQRNDD